MEGYLGFLSVLIVNETFYYYYYYNYYYYYYLWFDELRFGVSVWFDFVLFEVAPRFFVLFFVFAVLCTMQPLITDRHKWKLNNYQVISIQARFRSRVRSGARFIAQTSVRFIA